MGRAQPERQEAPAAVAVGPVIEVPGPTAALIDFTKRRTVITEQGVTTHGNVAGLPSTVHIPNGYI
jgi:hypothetical protein